MKFTIERVAICILIFVITIMIMRDCSRPSEEIESDRKQQYETEVAILKAEKTSIQAAQDSIGKVLIQRTRKDSLAIKRQESVIQALERKAARQRVIVDTLILNNPDLMAFVSTQQEVINELKVEIDTLKSQANFQRKLNEDLIAQEFVEDKVEAQMAIETSLRIAELEKQSKKKSPKRFVNILKEIGKDAIIFFAGYGLGKASG